MALDSILQRLAEVLGISARGDTQRKAELIKSMGADLRANPELVDDLKAYMLPDQFERAFGCYIAEEKPELPGLASALGDDFGQYKQTVKSLLAEAGSWLWKKDDVDKVLDDVLAGLQCAQILGGIAAADFRSFEDAFISLQNALLRQNHVPLTVWEEKFPALRRLFEIVRGKLPLGEELRQLQALLVNNAAIIKTNFFDPLFASQLSMAAEMFPGVWPESLRESRALYESLDADSSSLKEEEFKKRFAAALEERARNRFTNNLAAIWRQRTNTDDIGQWSRLHLIPPIFALETSDIEMAEEIAGVLLNPRNAAVERLEEVADFLAQPESIRDPDVARSAFLAHISYDRHKNIILMAGRDLTTWLADRLNREPKLWLSLPGLQNCLDDFVRESYSRSVQPISMRKINDIPPDQARAILLELAQKFPDVGFYIMERL